MKLSSVALTVSLLAPGANAAQPPPVGATGATAKPADVVWRYDTGG
jgi:hypothetical protein